MKQRFLALASLSLLTTCSNDGAASAKRVGTAEVAYDASIAAGTITGVVQFEGEAPPRRPIAIDASAGCGAHAHETLTETVLIENGRVQNAFVAVAQGVDASRVPAPPSEPVVLEQSGCTYRPHVLGLRVGQKLAVHNADPTLHNVNAKAQRAENPNFNNNQAPGAQPLELVFKQPESSVPLRCDIHPWMGAWVHAVEHPYFAVSAADGSFTITGLPPGKYELDAIHEWLGKQRFEVVLDGKSGARATVKWSEKH